MTAAPSSNDRIIIFFDDGENIFKEVFNDGEDIYKEALVTVVSPGHTGDPGHNGHLLDEQCSSQSKGDTIGQKWTEATYFT